MQAAIAAGRRAPMLQDTYFYEVLRPVNACLRRAAVGPILGFGQAVYPERFDSFRSRAWHHLLLARYLRTCDAHIVVSDELKRAYRRLGIPCQPRRRGPPGTRPDAHAPAA